MRHSLDKNGRHTKLLCWQMKMNIEKVRFCDIDDDIIRKFLKYLIESGYSLSARNNNWISAAQVRLLLEQPPQKTEPESGTVLSCCCSFLPE